MLQILSRQTAALAALMMFAACGDGDGGSTIDSGNTGPDAMNNPPNPSGLGPAPVVLGGTTDMAAAGERGRRQRQAARDEQTQNHRTKTTLAEIHDALQKRDWIIASASWRPTAELKLKKVL